MKAFFLIFIFFFTKLVAQVGPPDLRCLKVLPNGNVTLTWIAPSDPASLFNSYEIYFSTSAAGPYSLITTINAINVTSYTHITSLAAINSVYYYIQTKFGAGGSSISAPSDTLKSIFLNLLNTTGSPDVKLLYNNIHQPPLASSLNSFSLLKEYPALTWNSFATTSSTNYADTISVCQASLNYQATLQDISGCVSTSNIQGGVYKDKKNPNQPYIDSISVLPNGNTVIAWQIPRDLDIKKYIIVKNIFGINTPIDSVIGRNSTIYTFTTTEANNNAVQLYVYAVDSCGNPGAFDTKPTTIFLKVDYNQCAYQSTLTWNPYVNLPGGILEYRIYASVNGAPFIKIGSTTQTSFNVYNVPPDKNVCYFVRVINAPKTITASSNQACVITTQVQTSNFIYIKKASVINKNLAEIAFYIDTLKKSMGIELYRSVDGFNFTPVTFIPYNGQANLSYIDDKIETNNKSYFYKAVLRDSCGNLRTNSNLSKTILVKIQEDESDIFTKYLSWNDYIGFAGGVSGYNIYRIVNDIISPAPIATTGPNITNYADNLEDEAANGAKLEYLIEAVVGISNPYGFLEASKSNTAFVYMEGRLFITNAFAPKGKNKICLPVTYFVEKTDYSLSIFNRWGVRLFQTNDDTKGWDGAGNTDDVYVYLISYKNARGEYKEVKGTFFMYK